MICSIVSTSLMLHCTSCKAWLTAGDFEEHTFVSHHLRGELSYAIDRVACRIYMVVRSGIVNLSGEILDLWDTKLPVDDDCARMKLRNNVRFNEGVKLATEAAEKRVHRLAREFAAHLPGAE